MKILYVSATLFASMFLCSHNINASTSSQTELYEARSITSSTRSINYTEGDIAAIVRLELSDCSGVDISEISDDCMLVSDLGLDSLDLLQLCERLNHWFLIRINVVDFVEAGNSLNVAIVCDIVVRFHIYGDTEYHF